MTALSSSTGDQRAVHFWRAMMDLSESLEGAASFTEGSVQHCKQLAAFIRKRQEIEVEYAKSLRTLTPHAEPF